MRYSENIHFLVMSESGPRGWAENKLATEGEMTLKQQGINKYVHRLQKRSYYEMKLNVRELTVGNLCRLKSGRFLSPPPIRKPVSRRRRLSSSDPVLSSPPAHTKEDSYLYTCICIEKDRTTRTWATTVLHSTIVLRSLAPRTLHVGPTVVADWEW